MGILLQRDLKSPLMKKIPICKIAKLSFVSPLIPVPRLILQMQIFKKKTVRHSIVID